MKLSSGKIIQTPNVICCIASAVIMRQYNQYCEENDIEKLGHSTMYRINQVCPASVQKSMEGLDYFVLHLCKEEMDQMIKDLSECKQYLKHDFKIHHEEKTEIKDHCMTFSLNDKDLHFKNECCDHQHLKAQDGKGACDRKASHMKAEIKRYVNEGLNVLDANDMKKVSITACPYGLMLGATIGADF
ncbi:unnamed protein product [Mytilus coruscus]|uniref:Uncharacterized protein n=1 Tax=Mytilus coruscus TaxID=42192 RepID=A0A6J8A2G4_MYTCO|nr:unnamed protein product [Mytilus coruscus]